MRSFWRLGSNMSRKAGNPVAISNSFRNECFFRSRYFTSNAAKSVVEISKLSGADSGITILTLNNPKVNALSRQLIADLRSALDTVGSDDTRVVILRSAFGNVFCAGADLKERKSMTQSEASVFVNLLRDTFNKVETLSKPVIASIDGAAFGGGLELALACDLRVASPTAKMGLIETSLAIIPGAGGTQRLPRLVGRTLAKELIFTARKFDSNYALQIGLLNRVCDSGEATDEALTLAREILPNGPCAIIAAKRAINEGLDHASNIAEAMAVEQQCYQTIIPTEDRLEGLLAFKEKRKPVYTGK